MPQNRADLEPTYQDGRPYVPTGGLLNRIIRAIRATTPIAGPGLTEKATPQGIILSSAAAAADDTHPFQISTEVDGSNLLLRVRFGAITVQTLFEDRIQTEFPEIGLYYDQSTPTYLLGDPYFPAGAIGSTTLSASTTYGVWLAISRQPGGGVAGGFDVDFAGLTTQVFAPWAEILVSAEKHGPGYWSADRATAPPYDDDFAFVFLGRVVVDASKVPTIIQHRHSDLVLPMLAYPYGIAFPEA